MTFPTIKTECSEFIKDSGGIPMYKMLPSNRDSFIKVKARHKKHKNIPLASAFNNAFAETALKLMQIAKININQNLWSSNLCPSFPFCFGEKEDCNYHSCNSNIPRQI